jgi:hypothetical protein
MKFEHAMPLLHDTIFYKGMGPSVGIIAFLNLSTSPVKYELK